jgi:hypothetical protein
MNVYIYAADIYCEECGAAIRDQITGEGHAPADIDDETSYDSDEFPKGPYKDGGGKADCPQHCGCGAECVNAMTLDDDTKVGAWLENPLTTTGAEYVRDAYRKGGEVAAAWSVWYAEEFGNLPDDGEDDDESEPIPGAGGSWGDSPDTCAMEGSETDVHGGL